MLKRNPCWNSLIHLVSLACFHPDDHHLEEPSKARIYTPPSEDIDIAIDEDERTGRLTSEVVAELNILTISRIYPSLSKRKVSNIMKMLKLMQSLILYIVLIQCLINNSPYE